MTARRCAGVSIHLSEEAHERTVLCMAICTVFDASSTLKGKTLSDGVRARPLPDAVGLTQNTMCLLQRGGWSARRTRAGCTGACHHEADML